jgi:hypothetical protein
MFNPSNIPDDIKKELPGDFLAKNPVIPENRNYLLQNKFIFILSRCPTVTYFAQRVNLPSLSLGQSIQSTPTGIEMVRPGNRYIVEDIQLSFPVDENMVNYKEILDWMQKIAPWVNNKERLSEIHKTSSAILLILNNNYRPIISFKYYNIFPSFLSGLDFDVTSPDTDPVIASVIFNYTHFDILKDYTI